MRDKKLSNPQRSPFGPAPLPPDPVIPGFVWILVVIIISILGIVLWLWTALKHGRVT